MLSLALESGGKTSSLCVYALGVCVSVSVSVCMRACMLFVPVISVHARVYRTLLSSESMGLSAPSPLTGLLLIMILTVLFAVHTYLHIYDVMPYACLVIASPPLPPLPLRPSSPLLPSPPLPFPPPSPRCASTSVACSSVCWQVSRGTACRD